MEKNIIRGNHDILHLQNIDNSLDTYQQYTYVFNIQQNGYEWIQDESNGNEPEP
jgi:hypothetical protein